MRMHGQHAGLSNVVKKSMCRPVVLKEAMPALSLSCCSGSLVHEMLIVANAPKSSIRRQHEELLSCDGPSREVHDISLAWGHLLA
jgi:hypothetical protein